MTTTLRRPESYTLWSFAPWGTCLSLNRLEAGVARTAGHENSGRVNGAGDRGAN
jgi:hypothetical protein